MFPYIVKYTESEYDIQNNELLYKIAQQCQNTYELLENFEKSKNIYILFYYLYNFHNSFVVFCNLGDFCIFCIFVFLYLYILHV